MRISRIGPLWVSTAACLALSFAASLFAQKLELKVLSGRPDMVSGGSALVEVSGRSPDSLKVRLDHQAIPNGFRPARTAGTLVGRVEGLNPGANLLEISGGHGTQKIVLINHPIGGPVFSGPHQQPFVCQAEFSGLEKAVDADCNAPTRVEYFYRSIRKLTPEEAKRQPRGGELGPGYLPLNPSAEMPPDVAMTTTTDGTRLKFIVRVETGTINRGVYRIAFLHQPGQPLPDPWTSTPGWNGRLVYSFGGGCGTGFRQGQGPVALDIGAVGLGYAAAGSTLDVYGTNANDVINAETLMMVKEYFVKNFGVPVHTIGTGGSGGSIQQYLIAQNYPGLLDGIIPGSSFADHTSVAEPILDCALIGRVASAMKTGLTPDQRLAVSGYGSWGLCESRNGGAPNWMRAAACDRSMPKDKVYDPVTNPKGVRCSLQDNEANIYGRDPKTGAAPQIFDNVGVQYGLRAFNDGKISAEQFLELNEIIGGFDADGNLGPARSSGDPRALRIAYETGRIDTGGGGLGSVPIIDFRRYSDLAGDVHDRMRSAQVRLRLEHANGSAANQVLLVNPARGFNAVRLMDQWLDRIAADKSAGPVLQRIARNKPQDLVDACWGPNEEKITDSKRCDELYPPFQDPRLVAGEPLIGQSEKCALKPLDPKDYRQPLTETQFAWLKNIFPQGVCDYSRPGAGEVVAHRTWISYGDK
jgi:hypothetical protein